MHPLVHRTPDPIQVMSHAEQLGHQGGSSRLNLVFQGITAISLGVVTTKMLVDMVHQATRTTHHAGKSMQGWER